jgi:RHS repeat-associated protein
MRPGLLVTHAVTRAASSTGRLGMPLLLTVAGLAAVPALATAQTTTQVVEYYTTDALGSVRAVTKQVNGQWQVVARHDFMPFGEEVSPQYPPPDRRLFTGKERDAETGQDYFEARYYRSNLGRFTTVDPEHVGGDVGNPSTWNAYAYAGNNPLRNIDPDGRRWFSKNGNAVWVDANKDGTYTSPGEGWAELNPKNYDPGMSNVAFVDGTLSRIGEDANGGKMMTPWMAPEKGLEDTTFSLLSMLWVAGSAVRAAAGAVMGSRTVTEVAFDITRKGAQLPNIGARLTASEFQANLISSGFKVVRQTVGPNGPVTMLSDGQKLYTIYTATSTGGASAEVRIAGRLVSKIRLSGF